MGEGCLDRFSWLHFATGMIAYYWGVNFWVALLVHIIFEILENTEIGMKFITNIKIWPGGKAKADSFLNSTICDNAFFVFGYGVAYLLHKYEDKYMM